MYRKMTARRGLDVTNPFDVQRIRIWKLSKKTVELIAIRDENITHKYTKLRWDLYIVMEMEKKSTYHLLVFHFKLIFTIVIGTTAVLRKSLFYNVKRTQKKNSRTDVASWKNEEFFIKNAFDAKSNADTVTLSNKIRFMLLMKYFW